MYARQQGAGHQGSGQNKLLTAAHHLVVRGSVLLITDNEIVTGHNSRRVCHGGFSTTG